MSTLQFNTLEVDLFVKRLIWLEEININLFTTNKGRIEWVSYFDGDVWTIIIEYIDEFQD